MKFRLTSLHKKREEILRDKIAQKLGPQQAAEVSDVLESTKDLYKNAVRLYKMYRRANKFSNLVLDTPKLGGKSRECTKLEPLVPLCPTQFRFSLQWKYPTFWQPVLIFINLNFTFLIQAVLIATLTRLLPLQLSWIPLQLSWMHTTCVQRIFWAHVSDFVTSRPLLMPLVWSATITGSGFAAGCLRNLLPGSAPICLQWFKLVLTFSNNCKATAVTHTKRINRNLLREETNFVCYTSSVLYKSRHMKQKEKITHCF